MHLHMREELKEGKARLMIIIFGKVKYTIFEQKPDCCKAVDRCHKYTF